MTWERLRHFHKEPKVIAAWQKLLGPVLRWLTPVRRRSLLGLAALFMVGKFLWKHLTQEKHWPYSTRPDGVGLILLTVALFGFVWLCYLAARNFNSLPLWVRRHPHISVHAVLWALLLTLWTTWPANPTLRTLLLGFAFFMPSIVWRVGYMMFSAQRGKMAGTRFTDHLFYIFPVWGPGSDTPYGKGWDYLSASEAKDEEALAKSQLAGIKLLLLGLLWTVGNGLIKGMILGKDNAYQQTLGGLSPGLPTVGEMMSAQPREYPLWQCWLALYVDLFQHVLALCAKGHVVIGLVRLFGFNVFRNSYKPLLAETIVEFWSRYYYYFKELLTNFFFYPTYTRYFKGHPRLRMFAAVFMAAFVGNMYYHWLGLETTLASGSPRGMWVAMQCRVFYCLLLAIGIYVSMRREQQKGNIRAPRSLARRVVAIFGVWTFFTIIRIWAIKGEPPIAERFKFFLGLFGLG